MTFLRIKRKRNEEPLEGLVVDIPRKRQREEDRHHGLFKYVDTVEGENFFQDPTSARILQNKITSLSAASDALEDTSNSPITQSARDRIAPSPVTERTAHYNLVKSSSTGQSLSNDIASLNLDGDSKKPATTRQRSFTLYDGAPSNFGATSPDEINDPEMARFNDMVRDYLAEHSPDILSATTPGTQTEEDNEDFVYDVFYYQKESDPVQEGAFRNVALLTIRAEDDVEFLSFSDDEDEEVEDNDDPDSNDEDNPNNDYPDEESTENEYSDYNWSDQDNNDEEAYGY